MWSILFTVGLIGAMASVFLFNNAVWTMVFACLALISMLGAVVSEILKEERIKTLEEKIEELEGRDNA